MTRARLIAAALFVAFGVLLITVSSNSAVTDISNRRDSEKLVVHEWGTFTALQDENGMQLGGINVDDEPVPEFVHSLSPFVLGSQHATPPLFLSKGIPPRHPLVTMRLETPVVYFYPPKSQVGPLTVDVDVKFRGGWLTQFYPQANADAPGMKKGQFDHAAINSNTLGTLTWTGLQVGSSGKLPETDEAVWLTPRNVQASTVTMPNGESEKYLFYRGVGNINSPLQVITDVAGGNVSVSAFPDEAFPAGHLIQNLWLVQIRLDGSTAFRQFGPIQATTSPLNGAATMLRSTFAPTDFAHENLGKLQREMHTALVADGLFDEEAAAMLKTWEKSYFRSGGLRVFYLVPRPWIDRYLPLQISHKAEISRVMVARTELISPQQRNLLSKLAAGPASKPSWQAKLQDSPSVRKFRAGRSDFGDLGVPIPADYQTYLDLGRFRNALVLHEQLRKPTPALAQFIANYGLERFKPPIVTSGK